MDEGGFRGVSARAGYAAIRVRVVAVVLSLGRLYRCFVAVFGRAEAREGCRILMVCQIARPVSAECAYGGSRVSSLRR